MKDKSSIPLIICAIALALEGCKFSPTVWDGQWTLNKIKSHYAAPTLSITVSPSGEYRVYNDAFAYSFRCDGNDYPAASGDTTSCTQINSHAIALKQKMSAAVAIHALWELSADGKTLTINANKIQIDRSVKNGEKIFERISPSSGFTGRWRDTKPLESLSRTVVLVLNYGAFHLEYPDLGQFSDSRVNDPPSPIRGLNQPSGFSRSIQILGARQLQTEDSFAGRVVRRTNWRVSDDGRTLYEESWVPESPAQKNLLVYEKY